MPRISLLISGSIGLEMLLYIEKTQKVSAIVCDKNSIAIIDYALINNIPIFGRKPLKGELGDFLKKHDVEFIISVNYLFIIEADAINSVKAAVNIHGSLLPKYRGRSPFVWAIINNEKYVGATAHIMDNGCDTGDILEQETFAIEENDRVPELMAKFNPVCKNMITKILKRFSENNISGKPQDEKYATFFGKRNSEDGLINWNWQKERIRNWVRAQANPYPGAFSFSLGKKIVIHQVEIDCHGYHFENPNGLILEIYPDIIVKTPNGALKLLQIEGDTAFLEKGMILGKK